LRRAQTCAGLLVSLHGAEPAAHDAFAGVAGAFDETLGNIRRAVAAGLPVSISCVLTQHNIDQIGALCDLAARLGVTSTVFNRYIGAPLDDLSLSDRQLARAVERINARRSGGEPVRFGTCIPHCFAGPTSPGCLAGVAYCAVDPWGSIRPCSHVAWSAGSILDGALHDVWRAPAMQQWRSLSPDVCDGCASAPVCRGGCRAEAVLNRIPRDPLIRRAASIDEAGPPLKLYRFAQASLACEVRPQRFGYLLFSEDRMAAAVEAHAPVLDALRVGCSLDAVARQHGQAALDWVGELYAHDLVTLAL
jgi:radical SAM protein with 4Fe4S-binding SPASM domain